MSGTIITITPGDSVKKTYTQTGHGFDVGDAIYRSSGAWALSKADTDETSECEGVVESVNGDDFTMVESGLITGLSGGTDGATGYLSAATAGAITTTSPDPSIYVSREILRYTGTTTAIVGIMPGFRMAPTSGVQVDWDAISGLASILHKPSIPSTFDNLTDGDTNKAFTATEKTKLSGIAVGAEVNVQADWDAVSGDAEILNKPTILTPGGVILSGTQGARPAPGTAGRLYKPTDGYYPAYDTGAAWVPQPQMGASFSVTNPPAANTFTQINFTTGLLVADGDGLLFTQMGANVTSCVCVAAVKAIPAGAYSVVVGMEISLHALYYTGIGICMTDVATGSAKLWGFQIDNRSAAPATFAVNITYYASVTSATSDDISNQVGPPFSRGFLFFENF